MTILKGLCFRVKTATIEHDIVLIYRNGYIAFNLIVIIELLCKLKKKLFFDDVVTV